MDGYFRHQSFGNYFFYYISQEDYIVVRMKSVEQNAERPSVEAEGAASA